MTERVTLAQVARAAGVSAMTVSKVVNGRPGASDATRKRVMAALKQLGYMPNLSARSLKGGRTGLIGVVTLDLTSQYALEIVRGISDELAAAQLEVLISATYQDTEREIARIESLAGAIVDGLLLIAPVLERRTISVLLERQCPVVVIDPRRLDLGLPMVSVDNYRGTRLATEHLIEMGHRTIAYIGGDRDFDSSAGRRQGFLDAMTLAGLTADADLMAESDFSYEGGRSIGAQLLSSRVPSALVAASDLIALGAIDAARERGLDIPRQLSVVGFDDLPRAAQSVPALTTIRQPLHEMGQTAVRALLSQIENAPLPTQNIQLPVSLIVRDSTVRLGDQRK